MRLWASIVTFLAIAVQVDPSFVSPKAYSLLMSDEGLMGSFLQSLNRAQTYTTSSKSRRRTVRDQDCDDIQGHIDSIEDACNGHRWSVLQSLQDPFMDMLGKNATVDEGMNYLDLKFNGDPMQPMESPGILRDLLMQRIAIYGGMNPQTDRNELGAVQRMGNMYTVMKVMSKNSLNSLDNLWNATRRVDDFGEDKLYNQVFKYATTVQKLIGTMVNTSSKILAVDITQLNDFSKTANLQLKQLTKDICERQKELNGYAKKATDESMTNMTGLVKAVDATTTLSEDLMDHFIAMQDEATTITDSLLDKAEMFMDAGKGTVEGIANDFYDSFNNFALSILESFGEKGDEDIEFAFKEIQDYVNNQTGAFAGNLEATRVRVGEVRNDLSKKIGELRQLMESHIEAARAKEGPALWLLETNITKVQSKAELGANNLTQTGKEITMGLSDAITDVGDQASKLRVQLSNQVDIAARKAQTALSDASDVVKQTESSVNSMVSGKQSDVSDSLSQAGGSVGDNTMQSSKIVNDQANVVQRAKAVDDARMAAASDNAGALLRGGLEAARSSMMETSDALVSTGSQIEISRTQTLSDIRAAQAEASDSLKQSISEAKIAGTDAIARGEGKLADRMGSSISVLDAVKSSVAGSVNKLSQQQAASLNLASLGGQVAAAAGSGLENIADQISATDDGIAGQMDATMQSNIVKAQTDTEQIARDASGKVQDITQRLQGPLGLLIDGLRSSELKGGTFVDTFSVATLMPLLDSIQADMESLSDKKNATITEGLKNLEEGVIQAQQGLPEFFVEQSKTVQDMRTQNTKKIADRLASEMNRLKDDIQSIRSLPDTDKLKELQAELVKDEASMQPVLDRLNPRTVEMDSRIDQFESDLAVLNQQAMDRARKLATRIPVDSAAMRRSINATGEGQIQRVIESLDNATSAFHEIQEFYQERFTTGSTNMLGSASLLDNSGIRDIDATVNNISKVIFDQLNGLSSKALVDTQNRIDEWKRISGEDTTDMAAIAEEAKKLLAQFDDLVSKFSSTQRTGESNLGATAAEAKDLIAQASEAEAVGERALSAIADGTGGTTEFNTNSQVQIAKGVLGEKASSVGLVGQVVGDFKTAMTAVGDAQDSGSAEMEIQVADASASARDSLRDALRGVTNSFDRLKSNMGLTRSVNRFEIQKIRKYLDHVQRAWNEYAEYEAVKFGKMGDMDKNNLESMKRLVTESAAKGAEQVAQARMTLSGLKDQVTNQQSSLDIFQSSHEAAFNKTAASLDSLRTDTDDEKAEILSKLQDGIAKSDQDLKSRRSDVNLKIKTFDRNLATIVSKVYESLGGIV